MFNKKVAIACLVLSLGGAFTAVAKISTTEEAIAALNAEEESAKNEGRQFLKISGKKGFDALAKAISETRSASKRAALVRALGLFNLKEAEEAIKEELKSETPEILKAAANAAGILRKTSHVPRLIELMGSYYPEVQKAAVAALIEYHQEVKKSVEEALASPNPRLRAGALEVAAAIGIPNLEARIALMIDDADPIVSAGAIKSAGRLKMKETFQTILGLAKSYDPEISLAATEALTYYKTPEAEGALQQILISTADDGAKIIAVEYLSKLGVQGIEALLEANMNAGGILKAYIGKAAKEIADPVVISTLSSEIARSDPYRAQSAAEILMAIGGQGVEALFEQLHNSQDPLVRQNMKAFFVSMGEKMVPRLNAELSSSDTEYRTLLLEILGTIGNPSSLEPIAKLASSPNFKLRRAVVEALSNFNDPKIIKYIEPLATDPDSQVRKLVFRLAVNESSDQAVDLLIKGLKDADGDTRLQCIAALGKTGSERAVEPLGTLISAAEGYEQLYAIEALGKIKHPRATKILMELVASPNSKVSRAAQKAIK